MKANLTCPVCSQQFYGHPIEECNGYLLYHCPNCDVVFSDPMKGAGQEWYEDAKGFDRFESAKERLKDIFIKRKLIRKCFYDLDYNHKQLLTSKPKEGGRLLDIGCGEGAFLYYAQHYYRVVGLDFDREAIQAARGLYGLEQAYAQTLEQFIQTHRETQFDLVTLFEVLEHLEDPNHVMNLIKHILKPGGILVISLPNRNRKGANLDATDRPPNHLTRWSEKSIIFFLTQHRFKVERLFNHKTDPHGFLENELLLMYRLRWLTTALIHLFQRECLVRYKGEEWIIHEDTKVSTWMKALIRFSSSLSWYMLWPIYRILHQPSYGLYVEASYKR